MEWLNYHHLLYFWTVVHEGSVTAACKRLQLSPSTVRAPIGRLEGILGGKLFRRVGRGLILSDSPAQKGLRPKVYTHLLGECGITFFAGKKLCREFQPAFPQSLAGAPPCSFR